MMRPPYPKMMAPEHPFAHEQPFGSPHPGMMGPQYPGMMGTPYPGMMGTPYPGMMGPGHLGMMGPPKHVGCPTLLSLNMKIALNRFRKMGTEERQRVFFFLQQSGPFNDRQTNMRKWAMLRRCLKVENNSESEFTGIDLVEQLEAYWKSRPHFGHSSEYIAALHPSVREESISHFEQRLSDLEETDRSSEQYGIVRIVSSLLNWYKLVHADQSTKSIHSNNS
jgi:hypothetical protein